MNTARAATLFMFAVVLTAPAVVSSPAWAGEEQPGQVLSEWWESYYIQDKKVGYYHEKTTLVSEGDAELVKAEICDKIKLPRMGQVLTVVDEWVVYETKDGRPLRFERRAEVGALKTVLKGEIKDGKMTITTEGGKTTKLDWPKGARLPASHIPPFEGMKFEKGEKVSFKMYLSTAGRFLDHTCTALGDQKVKVGDEEMELHHVSISCKQLPMLVEHNWVNDDGEVLLREINIGRVKIRSVRTDMETALKDEPLGTLDLLTEWSFKCKQPFYHPYTSNSALYRISVKKGGVSDITVEFDNQSIEKRADDHLLVRIKAATPAEKQILKLPMKIEEDMSEFLKPSRFIQSDYEKIVNAAKETVGEEKDSFKAAKALEQWVFEYIKDKDMAVAFASAKEVFDRPQGDCTEHAVLLAAMLRAAGIPSRICTGVVYTPGMFMWHAWTEAYVGRWVALDATMPYDFVDSAHIAFLKDSMAKTNLGELNLAVMRYLGNVELELVEYTYLEKRGEKRVEKKGLLKSPTFIGKGIVTFRGFGISVPGHNFKSTGPNKGMWKCTRLGKNGEPAVKVTVAPFPPSQFGQIRKHLDKIAKEVKELKIDGAQGLRATLKGGGETAFILKGDVLVKAGYESKNEEYRAILDDILNGLRFSSE